MLTSKTLVIFAGGKGTRLGSLGKNVPKPAIEIGKSLLISIIIDWAQKNNFKRIIVAGGYLFNILCERINKHYNKNLVKFDEKTLSMNIKQDFTVFIRNTGENSLTGERLYMVRDLIPSDEIYFAVTYGDTVTDLDYCAVIKTANKIDTLVCLVAGYPDARYGEITIKKNKVTKFVEKGRPKFRVNRGYFLINKKIFDIWEPKKFLSLENNILPKLAKCGRLTAHLSNSCFFSVDTESDANRLSELIAKKEKK